MRKSRPTRNQLVGSIALAIDKWARDEGLGRPLNPDVRAAMASHIYEIGKELHRIGGSEGLLSVLWNMFGFGQYLKADLGEHYALRRARRR